MSSHRAGVAAGTEQPRPPRCAPSEPSGAVINPRGAGRRAPASCAARESGSAARRVRSSGCRGGRVRVRPAKLCLLGSGNLAIVCPGLKVATRGFAFTAPLVVRSVFQERWLGEMLRLWGEKAKGMRSRSA